MNGPPDPKDLHPPPPHEIFRRAMERKDSKKYNWDMFEEYTITPKKLDGFLKKVNKLYPKHFGLGGNCGKFAVGLKKFLERAFGLDVDIVGVVGEEEPEYFYHVGVEWNDDYYDIHGNQSEVELKRWAWDERYGGQKTEIVGIDERSAIKFTQPTARFDVEDYIGVFREEWITAEGDYHEYFE